MPIVKLVYLKCNVMVILISFDFHIDLRSNIWFRWAQYILKPLAYTERSLSINNNL